MPLYETPSYPFSSSFKRISRELNLLMKFRLSNFLFKIASYNFCSWRMVNFSGSNSNPIGLLNALRFNRTNALSTILLWPKIKLGAVFRLNHWAESNCFYSVKQHMTLLVNTKILLQTIDFYSLYMTILNIFKHQII